MKQDITVIYMSKSIKVFDSTALKLLVAVAARKNSDKGITGLLVKSGNHYLQVLEGPMAAVSILMDKIALDHRHREVRVLFREICKARVFDKWSMGCINLDQEYTTELNDYLRLRRQVHEIMSSEGATKEAIVEIIQAFPAFLQQHKEAA